MSAPTSVAVVADDLTSAGDGAAPFLVAGLPARILLDAPDGTSALPSGVTAVDLHTRAGAASAAGPATARAVLRLSSAGVLLKTVDSTVRGHLAAETRAALGASGRATAVVAPAFPAEGRTTAGAVQLLDGVPVDRTAFARDPAHPVREADLTVLVPGAVPAAPGRAVGELVGRVPYIVVDASDDGDLDRLVASVPRLSDVLWVGSPGLAAALARRLAADEGGGRGMPGPPAGAPLSGATRVLTVVGSLHPASRAQAARFASTAPAGAVPVDEPGAEDRLAGLLAESGAALLHGPAAHAAGRSVPAALARVVAGLAERGALDGLVVTGGETARGVLTALGTRVVALTGLPEPGVPVGTADRPAGLAVALKAGGFGDPETLLRLTGLLTVPVPGRNPCVR